MKHGKVHFCSHHTSLSHPITFSLRQSHTNACGVYWASSSFALSRMQGVYVSEALLSYDVEFNKDQVVTPLPTGDVHEETYFDFKLLPTSLVLDDIDSEHKLVCSSVCFVSHQILPFFTFCCKLRTYVLLPTHPNSSGAQVSFGLAWLHFPLCSYNYASIGMSMSCEKSISSTVNWVTTTSTTCTRCACFRLGPLSNGI